MVNTLLCTYNHLNAIAIAMEVHEVPSVVRHHSIEDTIQRTKAKSTDEVTLAHPALNKFGVAATVTTQYLIRRVQNQQTSLHPATSWVHLGHVLKFPILQTSYQPISTGKDLLSIVIM